MVEKKEPVQESPVISPAAQDREAAKTQRQTAAGGMNRDSVVAENGDVALVMRRAEDSGRKPQQAGDKGPPSSIETGIGSPTGASAGGETEYGEGAIRGNYEGRRGKMDEAKSQLYSVQVHTDEDGIEVFEEDADSGDAAARNALARKGYKGTSIRGVTPASDPDPNSLGGERDASVLIYNAENPGGGYDPLGTEANREATRELGKKDIEERGQ